jgi:formamidopyrimidine-DNA glycosylase
MPELPDVVLYVESLDRLLGGETIQDVRVRSPFVMRTFDLVSFKTRLCDGRHTLKRALADPKRFDGIGNAYGECNYCPGCQTEGRILSDRSLARLLKDDWPKTLDDLES